MRQVTTKGALRICTNCQEVPTTPTHTVAIGGPFRMLSKFTLASSSSLDAYGKCLQRGIRTQIRCWSHDSRTGGVQGVCARQTRRPEPVPGFVLPKPRLRTRTIADADCRLRLRARRHIFDARHPEWACSPTKARIRACVPLLVSLSSRCYLATVAAVAAPHRNKSASGAERLCSRLPLCAWKKSSPVVCGIATPSQFSKKLNYSILFM